MANTQADQYRVLDTGMEVLMASALAGASALPVRLPEGSRCDADGSIIVDFEDGSRTTIGELLVCERLAESLEPEKFRVVAAALVNLGVAFGAQQLRDSHAENSYETTLELLDVTRAKEYMDG